MTFGTVTEVDSDCDVVELKLETNDGGLLTMTALVVPLRLLSYNHESSMHT